MTYQYTLLEINLAPLLRWHPKKKACHLPNSMDFSGKKWKKHILAVKNFRAVVDGNVNHVAVDP